MSAAPIVCGTQPAGEPCDLIIYGDDSTWVLVTPVTTVAPTPTVSHPVSLPATGTTSAPLVAGASLSLLAGVCLTAFARWARRPVGT